MKTQDNIKLQELLNTFFKTELVLDGIIGTKTRSVIKLAKLQMCISNRSNQVLLKELKYYLNNYDKFYTVITTLKPAIKNAFASTIVRYDPLIFISQFALETGYLSNIIPNSYNLGNIKAKEGEPSILVDTHEYIKGVKVLVKQEPFKKYSSYNEFFKDYIKLIIHNDRYNKCVFAFHNPYLYFKGLYDGGYATDITYVDKLLNIYERLWIFNRLIGGGN